MPLIAPTIVTCHRCVKCDNEIPCLSGLYLIVNCSTGNTYGSFEISKLFLEILENNYCSFLSFKCHLLLTLL